MSKRARVVLDGVTQREPAVIASSAAAGHLTREENLRLLRISRRTRWGVLLLSLALATLCDLAYAPPYSWITTWLLALFGRAPRELSWLFTFGALLVSLRGVVRLARRLALLPEARSAPRKPYGHVRGLALALLVGGLWALYYAHLAADLAAGSDTLVKVPFDLVYQGDANMLRQEPRRFSSRWLEVEGGPAVWQDQAVFRERGTITHYVPVLAHEPPELAERQSSVPQVPLLLALSHEEMADFPREAGVFRGVVTDRDLPVAVLSHFSALQYHTTFSLVLEANVDPREQATRAKWLTLLGVTALLGAGATLVWYLRRERHVARRSLGARA